MNESATKLISHFTGSASLAVFGVKIQKLDLLAPIRKLMRIPQKTVKNTPFEKVSDAFTGILAGATGIVEVNTRAARVITHCNERSDGADVQNSR